MTEPALDPGDAPFDTITIPAGWSRPLTQAEADAANTLYPVPPYGDTYFPPGSRPGAGIPDAPDDGRSYVRQSGAWVVAAAPAGGGPGSGEWFKAAAAPPATGEFAEATGKLYVSKVTANNVNVTNIFPMAVKTGADVVIQDKDSIGNWSAYSLIADPIDRGDYFEMNVVSVGGGAPIPVGEKSILVFMR